MRSHFVFIFLFEDGQERHYDVRNHNYHEHQEGYALKEIERIVRNLKKNGGKVLFNGVKSLPEAGNAHNDSHAKSQNILDEEYYVGKTMREELYKQKDMNMTLFILANADAEEKYDGKQNLNYFHGAENGAFEQKSADYVCTGQKNHNSKP